MPQTFEARERLRDQQRQEARQLDVVLAAQRRLVAEREKAARVIDGVKEGVAARQADVDLAVVRLVETSGIGRTSILLGRPESELAGLVRAERRRSSPRTAGEGAQSATSS